MYPPLLQATPEDKVLFTMCVGVVDQFSSIVRNVTGAQNSTAKRNAARLPMKDSAATTKKNPGRAAKIQSSQSSHVGAGTPKKWVPLAPSYMKEAIPCQGNIHRDFDPYRLDTTRSFQPKQNLCHISCWPPYETYQVTAWFAKGPEGECLQGEDGLQHPEAHGKGTWEMKVNPRGTTTKELLVFLGRYGVDDDLPDDVVDCHVLYDGEWGAAKATSSLLSLAKTCLGDDAQRPKPKSAPGTVIRRIPNGYGRFSVREIHGDTYVRSQEEIDESPPNQEVMEDQLYDTGKDGKRYRWKVLAEGIWNQGVLVGPEATVGIMSGFPHYGKYADFRALVIAWALLRKWRIRIGQEGIKVQRWRGSVGADGQLRTTKSDEDTWVNDHDDSIAYGHVPSTDVADDVALLDLRLLQSRYFISKGLEALLVYSHSETAAASDWVKYNKQAELELPWYSFTQGLPDAEVFRLMWFCETARTGTGFAHDISVMPGWGTICNQKHTYDWVLFKFPLHQAEGEDTSDPITAGIERGKETMERGVDENFPGNNRYLLTQFLHRGNLVGIMANVAPAVHGGARGAPTYYSPFVGVFHHPDVTKYKYLNNTAWELQTAWAQVHFGRIIPALLRNAGRMLDVEHLLKTHARREPPLEEAFDTVEKEKWCALPGECYHRNDGAWRDLPLDYVCKETGNKHPMLAITDAGIETSCDDVMGKSAVDMRNALGVSNIAKLMYTPADLSCFRAQLNVMVPDPRNSDGSTVIANDTRGVWYDLPYNVVQAAAPPFTLHHLMHIADPYTPVTWTLCGGQLGVANDGALHCLGACVAYAAKMARPDDVGFFSRVARAMPPECNFTQGVHKLHEAKITTLSSRCVDPAPEWRVKTLQHPQKMIQGLLDPYSECHIELSQRAREKPGKFIFFLCRGIEDTGHAWHCYLVTISHNGSWIYNPNHTNMPLREGVLKFKLTGIAELRELVYRPASKKVGTTYWGAQATCLTQRGSVETTLQHIHFVRHAAYSQAIAYAGLFLTSKLLTYGWFTATAVEMPLFVQFLDPFTGQVNLKEYFAALHACGYSGSVDVLPVASPVHVRDILPRTKPQKKEAKEGKARAFVVEAHQQTPPGTIHPIVLTMGKGFQPMFYSPKLDALQAATTDCKPFKGVHLDAATTWELKLDRLGTAAETATDRDMRLWLRRHPKEGPRVIKTDVDLVQAAKDVKVKLVTPLFLQREGPRVIETDVDLVEAVNQYLELKYTPAYDLTNVVDHTEESATHGTSDGVHDDVGEDDDTQPDEGYEYNTATERPLKRQRMPPRVLANVHKLDNQRPIVDKSVYNKLIQAAERERNATQLRIQNVKAQVKSIRLLPGDDAPNDVDKNDNHDDGNDGASDIEHSSIGERNGVHN